MRYSWVPGSKIFIKIDNFNPLHLYFMPPTDTLATEYQIHCFHDPMFSHFDSIYCASTSSCNKMTETKE